VILAWIIARPAILVGMGAVALLGVLWTMDALEDRGFRNDIAKLEQSLKDEQQANAALRLAVSTHETSIEKLTSTIAEMNARLDVMNARARQIEAAANLRVARALQAGAEAAKELRAETTRVAPGNASMNEWLTMRMGL
jgi:septal ring factor EnvC (AmiA/AmiB activator)